MVSASDDGAALQVAPGGRTSYRWRAKVPSLNILLTSTAWRNDHNGFSHQGPGLIQTVINARAARCRGSTSTGRQLPSLRCRSLLPLEELRQPRRDRQAAAAAVADDGRGRRALRARAGIWDWAGTDDGTAIPTSCSPARATS